MISDEDLTLLSAFEDGELEGEQMSEFRHRLLQEPELRRELDAIRSTDERLRDYASWIDATPVPEQIARLVRLPAGRSATKLFPAAAAVFVLTIGTYLIIPNELDIDDSLLTFMESGQRIDFGEDYLEVVASFQQLDGSHCRELITRDSHQIVCLTGESWQSMIEVSRLDTPADAYQPAGGYMAPIDRYVRDHISGTVIEAVEEKQLIENDWQLLM